MKCPNCGSGYFTTITDYFLYGLEDDRAMEVEQNYRCKICEKTFIVTKQFLYVDTEYLDIETGEKKYGKSN